MTARVRKKSPEHHQHYELKLDTDEYARPMALDARSLTLPSVAIISIVLSCVWFTYFLVEERSRLDKRIDSVVTSVEKLATSISQLAQGLQIGVRDRFTRTDMMLFCANMQIDNKGFKCPQFNAGVSDDTSRLQQTLRNVGDESQDLVDKMKPQE